MDENIFANNLNGTALEACGVASGQGLLISAGSTAAALVVYVIGFFLVCPRSSSRPPTIFWMDISKIAIALGCALALRIFLPDPLAGESFDGLSWYVPEFVVDRVVGMPLVVAIANLLALLFRLMGKAFSALHYFGRYEPEEDQQMLLGTSYNTPAGPRALWWVAQLILVCGLVAGMHIASDVVVQTAEAQLGDASPFHRLAEAVHALDWPCTQKLLVVALAAGVGLDLLALLILDSGLKHQGRASSRRGNTNGPGSTPSFPLGSHVRALWKYTAQYEDELSFEAGEKIKIEGEVPGEELWFRGRIGNRTGLIPSNYVVEEGTQDRAPHLS